MRPLLLDTCAIIWWLRDQLEATTKAEIEQAGAAGRLYASPVSAWEIGLLSRKSGYAFPPDPKSWFARLMSFPIVSEAPLTSARALDAFFLPGELHNDPADRMLVATARDMGASLVTRDRKLIAYAAAGHMQVLAC